MTLYVGTTREDFDGRKVVELKYEAYRPMAQHELMRICREIRQRWDVVNVCIIHRLGFVSRGIL